MNYIVDTDILIYFFKNNKKVVEKFSGISAAYNHMTTI